jgi:hypothetical protein
MGSTELAQRRPSDHGLAGMVPYMAMSSRAPRSHQAPLDDAGQGWDTVEIGSETGCLGRLTPGTPTHRLPYDDMGQVD